MILLLSDGHYNDLTHVDILYKSTRWLKFIFDPNYKNSWFLSCFAIIVHEQYVYINTAVQNIVSTYT